MVVVIVACPVLGLWCFRVRFRMECRRRYSLVIVDLDGVVWRGGTPIEPNIEGLRCLRDEGARLVFVTNNATRSRRLYQVLLSKVVGWKVSIEEIVTSAYVLADWALRNHGNLLIYVIGGPGLLEELALAGHILVTEREVLRCMVDAVAVGLDTELTYTKIFHAAKAIRECKALFLVTNIDKTIPIEDALAPGAGSIVESLVVATGKRPDIVVGKPNKLMAEIILQKYGVDPRRVLVIGDRLDTDIVMAEYMNMDSLLVETGVPPGQGVQAKPTYKAPTIRDYVEKPLCDE